VQFDASLDPTGDAYRTGQTVRSPSTQYELAGHAMHAKPGDGL
jgi:hypothetical protein